MRPTTREQNLINEVGQLTHRNLKLVKQREEMQGDLIRQREDMKVALLRLERGEIASAADVLREGLAYRERTREKRKNADETQT